MSRSAECPPLSRVLQQEWEWLRTDADALARANSWQVTNEPFHDLDELLYSIGSHSDDPQADARLNVVVRLARYEELAGRVALQRLLAGILAIAKRRCQRADGTRAVGSFAVASFNEIVDELVTAAWLEIRGFGSRRRPACLAAALLRDTEHRVFRRRAASRLDQLSLPFDLIESGLITIGRAESGPTHLDSILDMVEVEDRQPVTPLVELAAVVRGCDLDGQERELLRHLLLGGVPAAAATLGVTDRTIRNRRQRLTERLRASA